MFACLLAYLLCMLVSEVPTTTSCAELEFRCESGACVHTSQRCDGTPDCPDQSDEKDCHTSAATTFPTTPSAGCGEFEFQCKSDANACIHWSWRCDDDPDCPDESDEENCTTVTPATPTTTTPESTTAAIGCDENEFQCKSGSRGCIRSSWRCDNAADCPDGSDEENCNTTAPTTPATAAPHSTTPAIVCGEFEFQCKSDASACIHWSWRCDGDPDCPDHSDEKHCNITTPLTPAMDSFVNSDCGEFEFQCESDPTACIHWSWRCDDDPDCPDHSDEKNCNATTTTATPTTITQATSTTATTTTTTAPSEPSTASSMCEENQFHCQSDPEDICIPKSSRCDGYPDCPGESDEENCRPNCVNPADQTGCPGKSVSVISSSA